MTSPNDDMWDGNRVSDGHTKTHCGLSASCQLMEDLQNWYSDLFSSYLRAYKDAEYLLDALLAINNATHLDQVKILAGKALNHEDIVLRRERRNRD